MAHICNPSNPGGSDKEDQNLKLAQANSSWNPISNSEVSTGRRGKHSGTNRHRQGLPQ
jgi:hypothetical protein